jgi:hypothetical protein
VARVALFTCGVILAVAGVALGASQLGSPSSPRTRHVVVDLVVAASPPRQSAPAVQSEASEQPSNRAAVYVPRPVSSAPPAIAGTATQGETLTEIHGTWSGSPTSYSYQWQRCDGAGNGCVAIAGATGQAYLLAAADVDGTLRVEETASNGSGSGSAALSAQSAIVQAPPTPPTTAATVAPPVLGQRGTAAVISGSVKIRLRGTSGFIVLTSTTSIPNGSEVDATDGRVRITVAGSTPGKTLSAEAYGGVFVFEQQRRAAGKTEFQLSLPLTGCPRSSGARSPSGSPAAGAKHSSRHLWVSETGGSWGTRGRYVSTTVEGTHWLTLDECDRSEVKVLAGRVRVRNLLTNATRVVSGGHRYFAIK